MARLSVIGFATIAIAFHITYIFTIFDIHFGDPVINDIINSYGEVSGTAQPARRVVVYVADGLRADKAFQLGQGPPFDDVIPFLRSKITGGGSFGVSHTHVPTETRPGLVALFAGVREDVSTFSTGWNIDPVNVDNVFNRSRRSWVWGGETSVAMFAKGTAQDRHYVDYWPKEMEDYSKDATDLDKWVFDRAASFFSTPTVAHPTLREDRTIFYFHFGGIDATGHSHRPYSHEYMNNILVVDEYVKNITNTVDIFFGDDGTAFLFTSDHGMTDRGAHGDGHPDSTRTPLIAWGSGIASARRSPVGAVAAGHQDQYSITWGLDGFQRNDVNQVDIASLISYLAGLNYPANAVGRLPLAYVSGDDRQKALAMLASTQSMSEMYRVSEQRRKRSTIAFKEFAGLRLDKDFRAIHNAVETGNFQQAIKLCIELQQHVLDGLNYLQTYDWLLLQTIVIAGYVGWSVFTAKGAIDSHVVQSRKGVHRDRSALYVIGLVFIIILSYFIICKKPLRYHLYLIFPSLFWGDILSQQQLLVIGIRRLNIRWPHILVLLTSSSFLVRKSCLRVCRLMVA